MLKQAFAKASDKPEGTSGIDFLEAVLSERPDLQGQNAYFPNQGQKGHTLIIGDEVFKGPKKPAGECMDDFNTECEFLQALKGSGLPVPKITAVGKDFFFFGMTRVPGVIMGHDFASRLTPQEQQSLAEDLVGFVIDMAHALPSQQGKIAVHDDLYYNNIFIDPDTKRLSGVIDFGIVKYKHPDEWKPMDDFKGKPFYTMLEEAFDRRKAECLLPKQDTGLRPIQKVTALLTRFVPSFSLSRR